VSSSIVVVPANEASCADLQAVFGTAGAAHRCQCQRQIWADRIWYSMPFEERAEHFREQTACGDPDAERTSGLVAYVDGEPAGWCAVEPRTAYRRLRNSPVPWKGRAEDRDDETVWAVACMVVRVGHRRSGLTTELVRAAVEHARDRGATVIEGYPMITEPGVEITWDELNVGPLNSFLAAGFREVSRPTKRRVVVRYDLR
jgi:GNAT superfamily N-acetyltransferase